MTEISLKTPASSLLDGQVVQLLYGTQCPPFRQPPDVATTCRSCVLSPWTPVDMLTALRCLSSVININIKNMYCKWYITNNVHTLYEKFTKPHEHIYNIFTTTKIVQGFHWLLALRSGFHCTTMRISDSLLIQLKNGHKTGVCLYDKCSTSWQNHSRSDVMKYRTKDCRQYFTMSSRSPLG